jgi:transposase
MWQYETFLHVKLPIVKTDEGKTETIDCPVMRSYSNYSYLFEALVLDLAKHMTVKKLAEQLKIHEHSIM